MTHSAVASETPKQETQIGWKITLCDRLIGHGTLKHGKIGEYMITSKKIYGDIDTIRSCMKKHVEYVLEWWYDGEYNDPYSPTYSEDAEIQETTRCYKLIDEWNGEELIIDILRHNDENSLYVPTISDGRIYIDIVEVVKVIRYKEVDYQNRLPATKSAGKTV